MSQIVTSLAEIADRYDAAFVDLWGCLHNGVHAFPDAVAAMRAFRTGGGRVVLVSNAPRPRAPIARQIAGLGIPEDAWDAIATSGDSARAAMFEGAVGTRVWFMGEAQDESFFEPLRLLERPLDIARVPLEEAEGIVCCGPFDRYAPPDSVKPELQIALGRGLKLLCANPDIVVDRGDTREWCAGAIAQIYAEMGGESLYFGKPHPPVYDLARRRLAESGEVPPADRILCIGDGIRTDILGAAGEDMDSLFVTGGLAAEETRTPRDASGQPDPDALATFLAAERIDPTFSIGFLR